MANTDGAFGLKPHGKILSANHYGILPGTTAIYRFDPVKKEGTGTAGGLSTVDIAGNTGAILGSVLGIFDDTGAPVGYYPAGNATGYTCVVADAPMQKYIIQEDSDSESVAQASFGLNFNLVAGTGSTSTGMSKWELDSSSKATTATHQIRHLYVAQSVDNAIGNYAKHVVKINNHANAGGTGTVGV